MAKLKPFYSEKIQYYSNGIKNPNKCSYSLLFICFFSIKNSIFAVYVHMVHIIINTRYCVRYFTVPEISQ